MLSQIKNHRVFKSNGVTSKCIKGVAKLGSGAFLERGFKFLLQVFLTRILVPEEFMIWGIIQAIIAVCEAVAEVGIRQAIVQNDRGHTPEFMNVAWWFQAVRACLLFILTLLFSSWFCSFYFSKHSALLELHSYSELVLLIRISFLAILCNGLISPGIHVLRKEFRFGKLVIFEQGSGFIGSIVTLLFAVFVVKNAWAIVLGLVAENICRLILSFIICPFMPSLNFDRESTRDLLRFARGMFGMPVLTILVTQIDDFFLGKMIAPDLYGRYTRAKFLSRIPQQWFGKVINPVLMPAFAEKKHDPDTMRKGLMMMTKATNVLFFPLLIFFILNAEHLLSIVWGEGYGIVAGAFVWLFAFVLLRTQSLYFISMTLAIGRPGLVRVFLLIRLILGAGIIYPAIKQFGISGAGASLVFSNFIALMYQIQTGKSLFGLNFRLYFSAWTRTILISLLFLFIGFIIARFCSGVLYLLLTGALCILCCVAGSLWEKSNTSGTLLTIQKTVKIKQDD